MWGNCLLLKSQGITLPTTSLHEVSQPVMSQQNLIEFRQGIWAGLHVVAGFPNSLTERIYLRIKNFVIRAEIPVMRQLMVMKLSARPGHFV
jgi:hypothetical protein